MQPNRRDIVAVLAAAAAKLLAVSQKAKASTQPEMLERAKAVAAQAAEIIGKDEQQKYGWYDKDGVRQGGLIAFVRYFWTVLEPETSFVDGWPLWAMCEHLEAVTAGKINRLLINIPPGCMKSLLVNVFWPAWEWGPMGKSHLRYVTFSYSASLTERDNGKFRDLVTSEPYQRLYGGGDKGVRLRNKTTLKVHNSRTGWKLASSVGGVGTGERGDRIILDDPHNVKDVESETVRTETTRWFRESLSSRFNNEATSFVVIMQRVHEDDVSGVILSPKENGETLGYCHLMIPMFYDWERQSLPDGSADETDIGWCDPRYDEDPDECDNVLAWPERFSPTTCDQLKTALGPYAWAGQYQQAPAPRGGGIFKRDWWQVWDRPERKHPEYEYMVASLDGAFTEDEENDPSALTIWGTFIDHNGNRRIMLVDAWRKWLKFSGPRVDRLRVPTVIDGKMWPADYVHPEMDRTIAAERNRVYRMRCMESWGLIETVADSCRRWGVDMLLIEGAASGISAAQEIRNRHGLEGWGVQIIPAKGDKLARAYAAVPTFSQLMVYCPRDPNGKEYDWAVKVMDEMAVFPRGKHDDLTDSACQAINYLRAIGLASSDVETQAATYEAVRHRQKLEPLYPV
jgi:predicted phage terminase large subunit-like protein